MTKDEFLKSKDFMRLGKCISSGQWQSVMMTISRMQRLALETGFSDFDKNLLNIRQCAMRKDVQGAKNALAVLINKRVAMMNRESAQ